jgi:hypothetical protein
MNISKSKEVSHREDEGAVVEIRDPAGEKMYQDDAQSKPVVITVAGTYSARYRRAADVNRDRMLKQRRNQLDGDQLNQQSLELVAACILSWDGFTADIDGAEQPYPLTKANAVALLAECPWIREQVEAAMNDHASFLA